MHVITMGKKIVAQKQADHCGLVKEKGPEWRNLHSICICLAQTKLWLYCGGTKHHEHSGGPVEGQTRVWCQSQKGLAKQQTIQ